MFKIKNIISFILFLFSLYHFLSFLILQARNHQILLEKQTLRLNLTPGHLGQQPLKPLGSEVTHPPWPPSVHHQSTTIIYISHSLHTPLSLNIPHNPFNMHQSPHVHLMQARISSHDTCSLIQWIFHALVCLRLCIHHMLQDLNYFSVFSISDTTF